MTPTIRSMSDTPVITVLEMGVLSLLLRIPLLHKISSIIHNKVGREKRVLKYYKI